MANTKLPINPQDLSTSLGLVETIQSPRFRAGGPSSSGLLNQLIKRVKNDISRLSTDVTDAADQARVMSLILAAQNVGFSKMYSTLSSQLAGVTAANPGPTGGRALADMYLGSNVVTSSNSTTADINPLFGQAILPARSRQSCLVIERTNGEPPAIPSETSLLVAIEPTQTSTLGATPPADYIFGEDPYSVYALDNNDLTAWIVEDSTTTPHMCWLDIVLPGSVSGAYRCNELELVPCPAFACDLISVTAEVAGQGWQDIDFSYLTGYDPNTKSVIGLGPSRLCFAQSSVTRFRLGLWCAGAWGFSSIRVLNATYNSSATLTVDYNSYSPSGPLQNVSLYGKNPSQLSYLAVQVPSPTKVSVTITPSASSNETPVICGVSATW